MHARARAVTTLPGASIATIRDRRYPLTIEVEGSTVIGLTPARQAPTANTV
jgi:hypothetical protein